MYTLKYPEFTNLFVKYFDKWCHGVDATYHKISSEFLFVKKPSCRQVFNRIYKNRWVIKRDNRLHQYYKKCSKRTIEIFSNFNNKRVLPIWVRPKHIDVRLDYEHWEVDFIIGQKASGFQNLSTLTERKNSQNCY